MKHWSSFGLAAGLMGSLLCVEPRQAFAAAPVGFAHRSGAQIVNGSGQVIKLRGVNFGGALLWEGWLFGMNTDPFGVNTARHAETYIVNRLAEKVGSVWAEQFRQQVYANSIRAQDFERVAQLGYNVVRLPFNHLVLEDDTAPSVYKASGWALLDNILSWAETYGVYVVLDLHSAPGGQSNKFIADPDGGQAKLWTDATNKERTVKLWRAIASRYKDRTIVAAYDLLNEPIPPNPDDLVPLYQQIIAAIREVDPNHMLIVEGGTYATDFSMFSGPLDANQAYSFHQYTWPQYYWSNQDRQGDLNRYNTVATAHGLPLWNGEFGVNVPHVVDSTVAMYEDPLNGIDGQAYWLWKRTVGGPLNYPALRDVGKPASWQPVLDWLDQVANPDPQAILQGLNDYIVQLRFENTVENPDIVAALQPNGRPPGGPAWQSPTLNVKGGWWTNGFEVNPAAAQNDDGTFAASMNVVINPDAPDSHNYYNFNFAIPAGAIIDGIEVRVDHRADAATGGPVLKISLSNDGGWTWAVNRSVPMAATTERTDIVGWNKDLWNKTWTAASFSNFRVGITASCVTGNLCSGVRDFYLDYVGARVFYH